MLTCKVGEKIINTIDYNDDQIRKWSNKGILKCPVCNSDMIYRHGEIKIAHFAHSKDAECEEFYSEPETEEHTKGKKIIYEWLNRQEKIKNLKLESWIPETKQRPDIYFEIENDRYVIEFQCTPIATEYLQRHRLYELAGIKDIWILGTVKYNISITDSYATHDVRLKEIEKYNYCYLDVDDSKIIINQESILEYFKPQYFSLSKYNIYSINDVHIENLGIKLNENIIKQLSDRDATINEKLEHARKIKELEEGNIRDLVDKLNKRYEVVNGVKEFYMSSGRSSYYVYSITCENIYNRLVFYINKDHTDLTKEISYTTPFRGKRGGIGWRRNTGHSKIASINHETIDTTIIQNFIVESLSEYLRKMKYPNYTKEALND